MFYILNLNYYSSHQLGLLILIYCIFLLKQLRHNTSTPFQEILNKVDVLNIPPKWNHNIDRVNAKLVLIFYKLGPFNENFTRAIEKQLILTEGTFKFFFQKFSKPFVI